MKAIGLLAVLSVAMLVIAYSITSHGEASHGKQGAPGHVPTRADGSRQEATTDSATRVAVPSPGGVHGRVRDVAGRGLAGLRVELRLAAGDRTGHRIGTALTGDAGRYWIPLEELRDGEVEPSVVGRVLRTPTTRLTIDGSAAHELDLVVLGEDQVGWLAGVVVDETGGAVAGALVTRVPPSGGGDRLVTTDEAGRFAINSGRLPTDAPFGFTVAHPRFVTHASRRDLTWGSRSLVVALKRRATLRVRVRDHESGQPIRDFGVAWFSAKRLGPESLMHDVAIRLRAEDHPDGEVEIPLRWHGPHYIIVVPGGDRHAFGHWRQVDVMPGGLAEIKLHALVDQVIEVVDCSGQAVSDARVEVLTSEEHLDAFSLAYRPGRRLHREDAQTTGLLHATGTTGPRGDCALRVPKSRGLVVRVSGEGMLTTLVDVDATDPAPQTVVLTRGSTLTVQLQPLDRLRQLRQLRQLGEKRPELFGAKLFRSGDFDEPFPIGAAEFVPIDSNGRFEITGIPPGDWTLCLLLPNFETVDQGDVTWYPAAKLDFLAPVHRRVTVPLGQFRATEATIRVVRQARAVPRAFIQLRHLPSRPPSDQLTQPRRYHLLANADGIATARLRPGRYSAWVPLKISDAYSIPNFPLGVIEVDSARIDLDLSFISRPVHVAVGDEEPHAYEIALADRSWRSVATSSNGWVRFPAVPGGKLVVRSLAAGDHGDLAEIHVAAGESPVVVKPKEPSSDHDSEKRE